MPSVQIHQCPRCDCAVDVEHCAVEDLVSHFVVYVYCEFCGVGWEALYKRTPTGTEHEFTVERDKTKDARGLQHLLRSLRMVNAA